MSIAIGMAIGESFQQSPSGVASGVWVNESSVAWTDESAAQWTTS